MSKDLFFLEKPSKMYYDKNTEILCKKLSLLFW